MPASHRLALGAEPSQQPIRLPIDAASHLAGVIRGVIFGLALLAPVIATALGPAVRRPYTSEATVPVCKASGTTPGTPAPECARR